MSGLVIRMLGYVFVAFEPFDVDGGGVVACFVGEWVTASEAWVEF